MTYTTNVYTCTIGCKDLVISLVIIFGGEFVQLFGDVVCCR
jgi:hypothetical protein